MKRQQIFVDDERYYALTCDEEGDLHIEVVVGGFAMEMMVVPLNGEE